MKILSVFTHPHVIPNLYVFICSAEHKGRYLKECFKQTDLIPHWLPYYGSQWGLRSVWFDQSVTTGNSAARIRVSA